MTLTLFSPAKINLFLRILGKRPDGYHELASLFQTIRLGDYLNFTLAKEDKFTCSEITLPTDPSNLVLKALQLFRQKSELRFSLHIHLEKKIPTQAGLGGGSSNAATTLWALNALHHFPYSEEELQLWSGEIGSDVPFFFSQGSAYCTGRGEKVRSLPPLPLSPFVLEKPSLGLATPTIYQALHLKECSKEDPESILEGFYHGNPRYINDLEAPALRLSSDLFSFKQTLLKKYAQVFMTGSGSAYVCLGQEQTPPLFRSKNEWYQ